MYLPRRSWLLVTFDPANNALRSLSLDWDSQGFPHLGSLFTYPWLWGTTGKPNLFSRIEIGRDTLTAVTNLQSILDESLWLRIASQNKKSNGADGIAKIEKLIYGVFQMTTQNLFKSFSTRLKQAPVDILDSSLDCSWQSFLLIGLSYTI